MKLKKLIDRVKSPCAKCPHNKLGMFGVPIESCLQCIVKDYLSHEWTLKQLSEEVQKK